ncbi:MAG: ABC transporter ATP-binding protein [Alphaproteobacteria bacterium]|nr:ABC transporter ATP-binding protein [Alphaproteobacteria bacterium]
MPQTPMHGPDRVIPAMSMDAERPAESLLRVKGLRTHIDVPGGVLRVLDGIDIEVGCARTVCIVGESGCGKSITARSILRLVPSPLRMVGGEILLRGRDGVEVDMARLDPYGKQMRSIRGRDIGMIFQEPMTALSPVHTIGNQMAEAIHLHEKVSRKEARERSIQMLHRVGLPKPAERLDAYSFQLSGGMRQRAMIAMALVCGPPLLIADEPTTALDVTTQAQILDLMRELRADTGMSILFITHDLGVVAEMADEVVVMYLGLVVERGPVAQVFHDPRHPYTRALLRSNPRHGGGAGRRLEAIAGGVPDLLNRPIGCPFHNRCAEAIPGTCDRLDPEPVALGGGHSARCWIADRPPALAGVPSTAPRAAAQIIVSPPVSATAPPILEIDRLSIHFAQRRGFLRRAMAPVRAVNALSLAVLPGETLGLVGESGCGKTTTGRCIIRTLDPTGGSIRFRQDDGSMLDVTHLPGSALKSYRRQVRMIFQDPYSSLDPRMTVADIVGEPLKVNGIAKGSELQDRVAALVRQVGLRDEHLRRYPHAFSGGERQRIGIARALSVNPKMVICDEAVSALDVSVQAQILNLLRDLQDELGLTYLFIAHDLSVVRHICDRVAVMYAGGIVELGETRQVFEAPRHPYTSALLSAAPVFDPQERAGRQRVILAGEVPDPAHLPSGCPFHPRCQHADGAQCTNEAPALLPRATAQSDGMPPNWTACHYANTLTLPAIDGQPPGSS